MVTEQVAGGAPVDKERPPLRRSFGLGAAVGAAVAVVTGAILYALLVMPFYLLARAAEPGRGLDRPFIRDAIVNVALPASVLLGLAVGVLVGIWYARGGQPSEWGKLHE